MLWDTFWGGGLVNKQSQKIDAHPTLQSGLLSIYIIISTWEMADKIQDIYLNDPKTGLQLQIIATLSNETSTPLVSVFSELKDTSFSDATSPDSRLHHIVMKYFNPDTDWDMTMANARLFERESWGRKHAVTENTLNGTKTRLNERAAEVVENMSATLPEALHVALKKLVAYIEDQVLTSAIDAVQARFVQIDNFDHVHVCHVDFIIDNARWPFEKHLLSIFGSGSTMTLKLRALKLGIYDQAKLLNDTQLRAPDQISMQ